MKSLTQREHARLEALECAKDCHGPARRALGRELASTAEAADSEMADDSGTRSTFVPLAKGLVVRARAKGAAEAFLSPPRLHFVSPG